MKRLPPYTIIAVCGILFLSAGMVIITADSTDTSAQPQPTVVVQPTDAQAPAQPAAQPTEVPPPQPVVQPTVVVPTEVMQPVVIPTNVVEPVQPTAVVEQPQTQPQTQPTAQIPAQSTLSNQLPVSPVPVQDGGAVVTPVIPQPSEPLGTLPPPANVAPTAQNPVVIPTNVVPTMVTVSQVTGQIGAPLKADYSGIVVILTRPDGSIQQTTTDGAGNFIFGNLSPGSYRVDAGASGYLSSQTAFTLVQGQNMVLPSAMLIGGDTNLDNKIDLTDAALIAANFDSTNSVAGADLNHDGIVDIRDLTAIGAYFGLAGPTQWKS